MVMSVEKVVVDKMPEGRVLWHHSYLADWFYRYLAESDYDSAARIAVVLRQWALREGRAMDDVFVRRSLKDEQATNGHISRLVAACEAMMAWSDHGVKPGPGLICKRKPYPFRTVMTSPGVVEDACVFCLPPLGKDHKDGCPWVEMTSIVEKLWVANDDHNPDAIS